MAGDLISLDQGNAKVPLSDISLVGRAVHLSLPTIRGSYDALLDPDGNRMDGEWVGQNLPPVSLTFVRQGYVAPPPIHYPFGPPLDVRSGVAPQRFRSEGKNWVAYELWLTNLSGESLHIQRIEVLEGSTTLAVFQGAAIHAVLTEIGGRDPDGNSIDGGHFSIARMWVALPDSLGSSATLRHRITVNGETIEAGRLALSNRPLLAIGAPLRGGNWRALNGPGPGSGHWKTVIVSGGTARFPDRFVIDWVRLGANGMTFAGDYGKNGNYYAYGQPVLAVADGVVDNVMDGIPQNAPGSHAVAITPMTVCGNSVTLKLGDGRFAFYCHMQPGSLRVRKGQRLRKGQLIGLVGNSGDSSEPHLHFQISDGKSLVGSEGIPYCLDSFETLRPDSKSDVRRKELPLRDQVVRFP